MHARYYSFHTARFLSVDPLGGSLGSSQSWNRYSYVINNPMRFIDPFGLTILEIIDGLYIDEISVTAEDPGGDGEGSPTTLPDTPVWDRVASDFAALAAYKGDQSRPDVAMSDPHFERWKTKFTSGYYWGTAYGEEALDYYADVLIRQGDPWYLDACAGLGGAASALWTSNAYWRTYGTVAGAAAGLALASPTGLFGIRLFASGGTQWHVGLETLASESLIHIGNSSRWGAHIALGYAGPRVAYYHLYFYPHGYLYIYGKGVVWSLY